MNLVVSVIEGAKITQPAFLKTISVGHKYADYLPDKYKGRRVQAYLLMSGKNAITDWHVDFSYTSVFYFVVSGVKEFFVIPKSNHDTAIWEHYRVQGKR